MTIATRLELRVPFLEHKLVEFAATLPQSAKLGGKGGKTILRNAMAESSGYDNRPPEEGFSRSDFILATRKHERIREGKSAGERFRLQPLNRSASMVKIVEDHADARAGRSQEIWTLLVFEFWHSFA